MNQASRRDLLRRSATLNGLDYVELAEDGRTLLLVFIKPPPESLTPANIRIEGGSRGARLRATAVALQIQPEEDPPAVLAVSLDRGGDHAAYRLVLQGVPDIDPRYACAPFRFHLAEATALDCASPPPAPAPLPTAPELDYLARDFTSFRQLMLDRLSLTMPGWQERHLPDLGIAVVEILAHAADHLAYWQDAVATEAYLGTARLRASVRRHVRLIDYPMHEGCNARAFIHLATDVPTELSAATLRFTTDEAAPSVFLPLGATTLRLKPAHNAIRLHAWGEPSAGLPRGATAATLLDEAPREPGDDPDAMPQRALHLNPGDLLLLEAVALPNGDLPEPTQRHVVRLIAVEQAEDALLGLPLLAVRWAAPDALPFALVFAAPGCPPLALARANLVLADHGAPAELAMLPGDRPVLAAPALSFATPPPAPEAPATAMLHQDPRAARPQLELHSQAPRSQPPLQRAWRLVPDLLRSRAGDHDAVAEPEADGTLYLRCKPAPPPGSRFTARGRLGNGPAGNLGADRITRVFHDGAELPGVQARNPLPAQGGIAPEPLDTVRVRAPRAIHASLARAITAADYAAIAGLHPGVQRAAARLRWTGSRQLVQVALDPLGAAEADPAMIAAVAAQLQPCRRIGHVLEVLPASYVPLNLALEVQLQPHHPRGLLHRALLERLGSGLLADGTRGLFHPDNFTFGEDVHASRILAAAQTLPGVAAVVLRRLERQYEGPDGEVAAGLLRIGAFEIARLDLDSDQPGRGRLTLHLWGGR
jgi:hypothetical protein